MLQQGTNAAGQLVRVVRDTSGALIELTLNSAGQLTGSRVLTSALTPIQGALQGGTVPGAVPGGALQAPALNGARP